MREINSGRHRRDERVIIIDVIGELFKAYSLATVVFCGGSLVPKGGQNILEPAAWGNVVFYGPYMEDFREEKELLEGTGAGITVRSEAELLNRILDVYESGEIPERGEAGRMMVVANMGAAQRYADMIQSHLTDKISHH
jgi:3-deoxy-D-manno-octulosonic-acid transferase